MPKAAYIPVGNGKPRADHGFDPDHTVLECHVVDPQEIESGGKLCLWMAKPGAGADKCGRLSELHGSPYREPNAVATIAFGGGQFRNLPTVLRGPVYLTFCKDAAAEPAAAEPADADAGAGAVGGSGEELPLPLRWCHHINDAHSVHNDGIYPEEIGCFVDRLWATCSPEEQNECIPVGLSDDEKWPVLPYRSHICDISGKAARRYHYPRSTPAIPAEAETEPEAEPPAKRHKPDTPAAKTLELVVVAGTERPFKKYVVWVTLQKRGLSILPWFRPQWPDRVGKPGPTAEACLDFNAALTELVYNHHRGRLGNAPGLGLAGIVPRGGYKTDEDYFAQCGHWRAGKALLACEWMATLLFAACVYGCQGAGEADFQRAVLWCERRDGICKPKTSNYEEWLKNPGSVRPQLRNTSP